VRHAIALHADAQLATGLVDALGNLVWPANVGLVALLLFVFPDGRLLSRRWRPLAWLMIALAASQSVMALLQPGPLEQVEGRSLVVNPLGVPALEPLISALYPLTQVVGDLLVLVAIGAVIVRYRRASGSVRQQMKWPAVGATLAVLFIVAGIVLATLLTPPGGDPQNSLISNLGFALAFLTLPVGVGIGVLRYKLYDIDLIINRALVYGALTAMLAIIYVVGVYGAHLVIARLSGHVGIQSQQPIVVVATTLLVAALARPLRARVQEAVDRRFYRHKYDAARTLAGFAATLRTETDLRDLSEHLVGIVDETMRPAHVSLWLRSPSPTKREVQR
jgi:hypothetical protein